MKVIEDKTQKKSERPIQVACTQCTSILEYTEADLTHRFSRIEGWTNSLQKYIGFICPCCGYEMGIKDA